MISPIVGTPAYKAGVKPGDEIEKIDGEPTTGMTVDDAIDNAYNYMRREAMKLNRIHQ